MKGTYGPSGRDRRVNRPRADFQEPVTNPFAPRSDAAEKVRGSQETLTAQLPRC